MRHFDEMELLDSVYVPELATEQQRHMTSCELCRTRFERVAAAMGRSARELDRTIAAKPETFWQRQRLAVMRDLDRAGSSFQWRRFGVAAALAVVIGGGFYARRGAEAPSVVVTPTPAVSVAVSAPPAATPLIESGSDPWSSEQLSGFQSVVDWQSWETSSEEKGNS